MNNASFTECTCEINNSQKDHVKGIDFAMLMYNFVEHSNNYFKTLGSLWKYYRNEPAQIIMVMLVFMLTVLHLNTKTEGKALADGNIKDIRTAAPLKVAVEELLKSL